jgi:hypothetical protein
MVNGRDGPDLTPAEQVEDAAEVSGDEGWPRRLAG